MNEFPFLSKTRPGPARRRIVEAFGALRNFLANATDRLRQGFAGLSRDWKRGVMVVYDVVAVSLALWLAYSVRYSIWIPPNTRDQWAGLAVAPLVSIPIFARLGLYRMVIRYLSERTVWRRGRRCSSRTAGASIATNGPTRTASWASSFA